MFKLWRGSFTWCEWYPDLSLCPDHLLCSKKYVSRQVVTASSIRHSSTASPSHPQRSSSPIFVVSKRMGWFNNVLINAKRVSPSDLLSYYTVKVARIKDWRLGLFWLTILIMTLIYISWNLIQNESYLAKSSPLGGTITVDAGWLKGVPERLPSYCTKGGLDGCVFLNEAQVALAETSGTLRLFFSLLVWRWRPLSHHPMDAVTFYLHHRRAHRPHHHQTLQLNATGQFESRQNYFVANVDSLTILLTHTVRSPHPYPSSHRPHRLPRRPLHSRI
ncbi:hypothetical protein BC829DRAFT_293090 [Chytridium lagenaria]|nr:hypothetical protein BC829DRAFT_293090 [Chytridium lagenaria]